MNKKLLLSLPLAALLASCSSDENVQEQNERKEIKFTIGVKSPTVKSETNASTLTDFNLSAYQNSSVYANIDNTTINKPVSGTIWSLSPAKYWPNSGTLDFLAYAPSSIGATIASDKITLSDYEPSTADVAAQTDIITAIAANQSTSPVALQFNHALSKIVIKAKNESMAGYTVEIKGVKLGWIGTNKADMSVTSTGATWTPASDVTNTSYKIESSDATTVAFNDYSSDYTTRSAQDIMFGKDGFYLIPQQLTAWSNGTPSTKNAFISVLCKIKQYGTQIFPTTGDFGWAGATGIDTKWEAGKMYTYTLEFFNDGTGGFGYPDPEDPPTGTTPGSPIITNPSSDIKFTVTIDDWSTSNTSISVPYSN